MGQQDLFFGGPETDLEGKQEKAVGPDGGIERCRSTRIVFGQSRENKVVIRTETGGHSCINNYRRLQSCYKLSNNMNNIDSILRNFKKFFKNVLTKVLTNPDSSAKLHLSTRNTAEDIINLTIKNE